MRNAKGRNGKATAIAKLDFHDTHSGMIEDRIKCPITDKNKGVLMIMKIKERFVLSDDDIAQRETVVRSVPEENEDVPEWKKPIMWKRDERGNII